MKMEERRELRIETQQKLIMYKKSVMKPDTW